MAGGRPRDPIWTHFHKDERSPRRRRVTCVYCSINFAANPMRMRKHVLQCPGRRLTHDMTPLTCDDNDIALERRTILCFGDSLTWGMDPSPSFAPQRLPYEHRWTSYLSYHLEEQFVVVVDGLNERTTVFENPLCPYNVNASTQLPSILHSHAPIHTIVLQLGLCDLHMRLCTRPLDVVLGLMKVVSIIRHFASSTPILILALPVVFDNETTERWGYVNLASRCQQVNLELQKTIGGLTNNVHFIPLPTVRAGIDGIHLTNENNQRVGQIVNNAITSLFPSSSRGY